MKDYIFVIIIIIISSYIGYAQSAESLFKSAVIEFENGNSIKANELITKAINLDFKNSKKDFLKYYNRGIILLEIDSLDKAIIDFKEVLNLKKDFAPAHEYLSICFYYQSNLLDALSYIENAINLSPQNIEYNAFYCVINFELKNYDLIIDKCKKFVVIIEDSRFDSYLAMALLEKEDLLGAINVLEKGEEKYGNNTHISEAKAFLLFKKGELEASCDNIIKIRAMIEGELIPIVNNSSFIDFVLNCK